MAILTEAVGLTKELIQIFTPKEPTPEEQKAKAGVWYRMLQDFVINKRTPDALAAAWRDQLPFAQKSTKQKFVDNNIKGKDYDSIVNTLIGKINDELVKGGFDAMPTSTILEGMGAGANSVQPSNMAKISAISNTGYPIQDLEPVTAANESRNYFYAGALLLIGIGVFAWSIFKKKKRRR